MEAAFQQPRSELISQMTQEFFVPIHGGSSVKGSLHLREALDHGLETGSQGPALLESASAPGQATVCISVSLSWLVDP